MFVDVNGDSINSTGIEVKRLTEQVYSVKRGSRHYAMIVALDKDGGYAREGVIPWHYPEDLMHFRTVTTGTVCVMGKTTYLDICKRLGDKSKESVLPGRKCVVVSTTLKGVKNAIVVKSLNELEDVLEPNESVSIIGGGRLFAAGLDFVDVVYVTAIRKSYGCDSFFPTGVLETKYHVLRVANSDVTKDLQFAIFLRKKDK